MTKLSFSVIPLLIISLFSLSGCGGLDDNNNEPGGGDNGGEDDPGSGDVYVALEKLEVISALPSIITIFFQAKDENQKPLPNLINEQFIVLEDGQDPGLDEAGKEIVPNGELPYTLKTILMLDVSGSISDIELEQMKNAVEALIIDDNGDSLLLPKQEMAIFTFDEEVHTIQTLTNNHTTLLSSLRSITGASGALRATNLYGAVLAGISQWTDIFTTEKIVQGNLILITDGKDTTATYLLNSTVEAITDNNKNTFTIGIGNETDQIALSKLGRSGTFHVNNFDDLQGALAATTQDITDLANSFYYLHYASPKRQADGPRINSDHLLTLKVLNNKNTAGDNKIEATFNSFDFETSTPEVVISGPNKIDDGSLAFYTARTRWTSNPSHFEWLINGDCIAQSPSDSATQTILGNNTGSLNGECLLTATDTNNNDISNTPPYIVQVTPSE